MKRKWIIIKWMAAQVRSYLISLVLIIVMSIILSLCRVAMAIVSKDLIDSAINGVWQEVVKACILFSASILIQIGLKGGISLLSVQTSESMSNKIRYQLFSGLVKVKWTQYSTYHSGDFLTRLTSDVGIVVEGLIHAAPEIISLGVGLIASFLTLFSFDPVLAVFAFLLGPVAIVISCLFGARFMSLHERAQEAEGKYRSYMQECLEHMLIIKTFCCEEESGRQIRKLQEEKKRLAVKKNIATVISSSLVTGGFWLSYLLAFSWGAFRLFKGSITFGTLTAFLQLIGQVQTPFLGLAGTFPQVVSTIASAKRLMEIEKLQTEEQGNPSVVRDFTGITLENIDFYYQKGQPVLKNITASMKEGEMIGLIGMSGQGKTTLIHLLMQLLEPVNGSIYYHYGKNRKKAAEASIRSLISYVPQGNTLFSGSIAYNLRLGCGEATEEELIEALKGADAWDFVKKLPEGIHTVIGERGLGLSEGQAQRIAIARAFIRKTPILLLDEATSALDAETEKKVLQAILDLRPRRTCIIITHRPSMLDYCQRIWKLSMGELIEPTKDISEVEATEAI